MAPGPPDGKIHIQLWDYPRLPAVADWLQKKIAEFQQLNPDVHVEYTRLSWSKGTERLDIAAFAGRPPDIAGSTLSLKYMEAGLLEPLDQYLDEPVPDGAGTFREDIHSDILRDIQWEGRSYLFPWYKEGFVLLLNKDIFEERDVPLPENGLWEYEEFLTAMRRLTFDRDGDGSTDVYGIGYSTGPEKWEAFPFLIGEGMQFLDDSGREILVGSEESVIGINRLIEMEFEEKVALPGAGGMQDETTWSAFTGRDRRLATTCQGLWAINAVRIQNERRAESLASGIPEEELPPSLNVMVALPPKMPGHPQKMASYGVGGYMVFKRPNSPERTEAAARLARFLTLEQGQEINGAAGQLPSRKSYLYVLENDLMFQDILPFMPGAVSPPIHPAWKQLDRVIGEQLQLALLRQITPKQAVDNMAERCTITLNDYWASIDASAK